MVHVMCWASEGRETLEKAGYHHEQPLGNLSTQQVSEVTATLFDAGLNVMLAHYDKDVVIWVDTRKFSQR